MKIFKQSNDYVAGTWKRWTERTGDSAVVTCPDCKSACSLMNHEIHKDGMVTPSVVCPTEGCTFHEYIQLEGWGKGIIHE